MSHATMRGTTLWLVALSGCFADRTPPENLPCAVESDCPATTTCRTAIGLCVAVDGLDAVPPTVDDVVITPAAATHLDEIRVTFTSEPLLEPPTLTTDADGVVFAVFGNDGDTWTFTATVDDSAVDSGVHDISADLIDASGNGARVPVGSFVLDFDPPELLDCYFDPPSISLGNPDDFFVEVSLVLTGTDVTILDLELVARPPATGAYFLDYTVGISESESVLEATYEKTGDEVAGTYEVIYVVKDGLGNLANAIGCQLEITP